MQLAAFAFRTYSSEVYVNDLIGQRLGQYEITGPLGKGGMAVVYRARQASMRREVAIKVINASAAHEDDFVPRFEREAQTVAALSHPHILKVFDYGHTDDGIVYLAMELLPGGSLAGRLRQGPLPPAEAARLFDQIAGALHYAHSLGIVHRDVKPQNILLDPSGNAILTDFGIAKLMATTFLFPQDDPGAAVSLTQSGVLMGTPAYMAPEQVMGKPIDSRTDIYALGIILYEMLTGQMPFRADTPFAVMHMHVHDTPPPASRARVGLPPGVDAVIDRALAKDPAHRYPSAIALSEAFQAALRGDAPRPTAYPPIEETGALPSPPAYGVSNRSPALADDQETYRAPVIPAPNPTGAPATAVSSPTGVPVGRRLPRAAILGGIVGVVAIVLIAAVVIALSGRTAPPESSAFAIAVAPFSVDPATGVTANDVSALNTAFVRNLNEQIASSAKSLSLQIGVWTPDQVGVAIGGKDDTERATNAQALFKTLKARYGFQPDILIYGAIERHGSDTVFAPHFAISDTLPEISNLYGGFNLEDILVVPNQNNLNALAGPLTDRSRLLAFVTAGLVQLVNNQYDAAISSFQGALTLNASDKTGKELIYVFIGNGLLADYNWRIVNDSHPSAAVLTDLLAKAKDAFTQATTLNPDYARGYAGLGSILYLEALRTMTTPGGWSDISDESLDAVAAAYQSALTAADHPVTADIPTKAALGLGQVALLRYLKSGSQADWSAAKKQFDAVLNDYADGANPRVADFAAEATDRIGLLWERAGQLEQAKAAYQAAIKLSTVSARRNTFQRSLAELSFTQLRTASQADPSKVDAAAQIYDDLLTNVSMSPSDAAAYRYQEGKLYDEANRLSDAVNTYTVALALNLRGDDVLHAQLLVALGDVYAEQNQPAYAIDVYAQALKLDPDGQANLSGAIETLRTQITPSPVPTVGSAR